MTWLNPWAALFLLLIPAVIALYFLRLRREDVVISSTLLWSRVLEDRRVNSPFQKLRKNLLLLLQILAILMLVAALARPESESETLEGLTHILLLDVSASMGASEGRETRLDQARRIARNYLAALGKSERAVLIRFARSAKAISPVTGDLDQLMAAADGLDVQPADAHIDAAMELALSIARNQIDALAVVISDGGFPAWEGGEIPLPVKFLPVGTPRANSGIVALSSRMDLSGSGRPQIFVEVRNYGDETVAGDLSIVERGELIRADHPAVAAGGRWNGSFEAFGDGLVEVIWEPQGDDALGFDDRAWVNLEPRRGLRVWRVGASNYFLDEALEALPQVQTEALALAEVERRVQSEDRPDVVLWDRVAPEKLLPFPGQLFFAVVPPGFWEEIPIEKYPEIVAWDRGHPVNRFITYAKIEVIEESLVLPAAPGTEILVDTRGGGLISSFNAPGTRGVVVGFDVLRSDWPLRIAFPLFLFNAIQWVSTADAGAELGVRGGELIKVRVGATAREPEVIRPGGGVVAVTPDGDRWVRYAETDELGPYTVRWMETHAAKEHETVRIVPVNLLSARESNLTPRVSVDFGGRTVSGSVGALAPARREYWPWILCAGLALLMVEWYTFHRR